MVSPGNNELNGRLMYRAASNIVVLVFIYFPTAALHLILILRVTRWVIDRWHAVSSNGQAFDIVNMDGHQKNRVVDYHIGMNLLTIRIVKDQWCLQICFIWSESVTPFLTLQSMCHDYRKSSSSSLTKSESLNITCILAQLSSLNPLKPAVKLRMKM